ncbi:MAG TPA: TetR/AcrR family transcriptional regulator C-terminal domain-containing protein, partial [Nitrospiria bacterium]
DFFKIYATELGGADCSVKGPPGQKLMEEFKGYIQIISNVIREGMEAGMIRKGDAESLAYVLNGIMTALIRPWILGADQDSLTAKGDLIKGVFLRGVSLKNETGKS